ncbi:MAG: (d)CMP kinase [Crocinitomicaceae bacterium]|jgi:CMP/dCMP kinase|nr:(d)CMP kinase [Crocinitomicaceae bacterium]MDP4760512.1 (d)CMP kinase [Crocinitomicaceae bacterium]
MNQKKITIAIDGFSACGKSTLAKDLAKRLAYVFIDSGAMYRAAALYCLKHQLIQDGKLDTVGIDNQLSQMDIHFETVSSESHILLNGQDVSNEIRESKVAEIVSIVAAYKPIREKLVQAQQEMGAKGGIVMDGRDIGSVVFPDAELKIFVTADPEIRVQRRLSEMVTKGMHTSIEEIRKNLAERDHLDSTREESPLIQVSDALVLDNSQLTKEEQLDWVLDKVALIVSN